MSEISKIHYGKDMAPFGEVDFYFSGTDTPHQINSSVFRVMSSSVTDKAWRASGWLQDSHPTIETPEELEAEYAVNKLSPIKRLPVAIDAEVLTIMSYETSSNEATGRHSIMAVRPVHKKEKYPFIRPSEVVGWGGVEKTFREKPFKQFLKLFTLSGPENEWHIKGINVSPNEQARGIGTVILYHLLNLYPPNEQPITYCPSDNVRTIRQLEGIGFTNMGELNDSHALGKNYTLKSLRMVAPSATAVMAELIRKNDWLLKGQSVSR